MQGARGIESLGQMGVQLTSEVELLALGCCGVREGVDYAFGMSFGMALVMDGGHGVTIGMIHC